MRDDFAILILSHGRPDNVVTLRSLERHRYTGRWYIVIDDEDPTGDQYRDLYGDKVVTFSKADIADTFDKGGLEPDRNVVVYARNAAWQIAKDLGLRWFAVFDDDYTHFHFRWYGRKGDNTYPDYHGWNTRQLDAIFEALIRFMEATTHPVMTIATAQGGDGIGGKRGSMARIRLKRKAMNSFFLDTERPFQFVGRINEDVNAYVWNGYRGELFFTYSPIQLEQIATQANEGGLTGAYLDAGTYIKSFLTVMWCPSFVKVRSMGVTDRRLHHAIKWNNAVPKIVHQDLQRT